MKAILLALAAGLLMTQVQQSAEERVPRRARSLHPMQSYFSTDDYPAAAARRQAEGTTSYALEIDSRGTPTRCTVGVSSGDADLDRATCEIMMSRARFSPARDASGRAVADRMTNRVRWVLPKQAEAYPFISFRMVSSTSTRAGRLHCSSTFNGEESWTGTGEICRLAVGDEAIELINNLGTDAELTMVVLFHPDGTAPPRDDVARGEPLVDLAARISVAPDGNVANCRSTRRILARAVARLREAPDICDYPIFTKPEAFWVEEGATGPQFAAASLRLYLRTGPGR